MRTYLLLFVLAAPLAEAGWYAHEETRTLSLDATALAALHVESRHGFVVVEGDESADEITVTATIKVPRSNESKAQDIIADALTLSLDSRDQTATLKGYFPDNVWRFGDGPSVSLKISVPQRMAVSVDDGTGYIVINSVRGDINIDDGSGSIELQNVGGVVRIDDGSGWIDAKVIGGDVHIKDRSGAITVSDVTGSVTIDDGSGRIDVDDVSENLIILSDGSGRLHFDDIEGYVKTGS